jgi:hypothetical protein
MFMKQMSFEAESNSELTVIVPAYQLYFRFPVQNKIHKQKNLSDTGTCILGSIVGPCDFLPARSDEFKKVWGFIFSCLLNCIINSFIYIRSNLNRIVCENVKSFVIANWI